MPAINPWDPGDAVRHERGHRVARTPGHRGHSMRTAVALSKVELSDWTGASTRLGDLWEDRPVVLVFIRHFG